MISEYENMDANSSISSKNSEDIHLNIENAVIIDNVQEETNLINYTLNHFNTKIQEDLNKIRDMHIHSTFYNLDGGSNSPLTLSNNSSDSDSNYNVESDDENAILPIEGYKKLSYKDVEKMINKYYDFNSDNKFSSEIDILTTFIKAQKNLYIQSKYSTQKKLNCLMLPSLFISAFITIIAPFTECNYWTGGLISGLNAIIMLCVSLINYLKLESSIENYLQNVKQYDKLETTLEMTNNKLLFIDNNKEKNFIVLNKIKEIEKKIGEIKESSNVLIPEDVKNLFPIICNINIFSFIKRVEIFKKNLIIKFKDVKNEIRYILFKLENFKKDTKDIDDQITKFQTRLEFLYQIKNKLKTEIFDFQSAYSHIDSIFTKEIKNAEIKNTWSFCCFYFYDNSKNKSYYKGMNPIIDKYFHFIFVEDE